MTTVACLVCTNRPEWEHWFQYQIGKQLGQSRLTLVGDGPGSIPEKRTRLVRNALESGAEYLAWFDDDDWQSTSRLERAVRLMAADPSIAAVGNVRSRFVHARTMRSISYQAPEGIIFNGAVFRIRDARGVLVPDSFSLALTTQEDTEWILRWLKRKPNYVILGEPMSMWLCHESNITNRSELRSFEEGLPMGLITDEERALIPT